MTSLPHPDASATQHPISFDELLKATPMPEPGPEYFEARRRLWLTPRLNPDTLSTRLAVNRQKLESLLSNEDRLYSAQAWRAISSGQRMKRNLPLPVLIKIIHASWLRDKTWPVGVVVPDSDDDQAINQYSAAAIHNTAGPSGQMS